MRRRDLLGLGLVAGTLAACGGTETGDPQAEGPHAAVVPGQADQILAAVDAALARAYQARNPRLLGARVVGPASRILAARLTVAAKEKKALPPPGTFALKRLVLPAAGDWPRWILAAGTLPGQPTPVLRVLRSLTAREPYGLWGDLTLLPGASLPTLASPFAGTPLLPPAVTTGLVRAPSAIVTDYAAALMSSTPSATGNRFAPDQFREQVAGQLAADRRTLAAGGVARVDASHRPSADGLVSLRTQDGGALVVGALEQLYTVTVRGGAGQVTLDADLAALAGVARIGRSLQRTSVETLAFRVPPAGGGPVSLLAAAKGDVSAVGS